MDEQREGRKEEEGEPSDFLLMFFPGHAEQDHIWAMIVRFEVGHIGRIIGREYRRIVLADTAALPPERALIVLI